MKKFQYLQSYVHKKPLTSFPAALHVFFPASSQEIKQCEQYFTGGLPKELAVFYKEVGFGFVYPEASQRLFNRIISPSELIELSSREATMLPFLEVKEDIYMFIDHTGSIYWQHERIATDIRDLLAKMEQRLTFFLRGSSFTLSLLA
ncbi:hypothetical protein [Priestia endophytica]|uniref:hypothetical protein n=1 Tax=Priestia endophytica TaxID=135735 RepID=UPI0022802A35|nr:hypothetical protein [Priestia endophytica]MCY8231068.1 hypothetical protein [Priestia endophytica]